MRCLIFFLAGMSCVQLAAARQTTDFEQCLLQQLEDPANQFSTVASIRSACSTQFLDPSAELAAASPAVMPDNTGSEQASSGALESSAAEVLPAGFRTFFQPYKNNYILFGAMENKNGGQPFSGKTGDIRFEFGLKFRLFERALENSRFGPLYFGYSQRSWWDIAESSAPFAEHNYSPEIFWDFQDERAPDGLVPFELGQFVDRFGFEHQSNGRDGPLSRSWDRLYAQKTLDVNNDLQVKLKLWNVMNLGDENDDITDYLGNAEVEFRYQMNHDLNLKLRTLKGHETSKVSYQLDFIYTMGSWLNSKFMLSYYDGYGEALVSYNEKTRSLRAGVFVPIVFE